MPCSNHVIAYFLCEMGTNWRLDFRKMSRCRDVKHLITGQFLFFHRSLRTAKRTSPWISDILDIVHVTGRIHVKVRFWYNYYFLLYWGNYQGQGSDVFLIGLSARLTLIGILKGDIELVIQDIQTFCLNRSNSTEKSISGRFNFRLYKLENQDARTRLPYSLISSR